MNTSINGRANMIRIDDDDDYDYYYYDDDD